MSVIVDKNSRFEILFLYEKLYETYNNEEHNIGISIVNLDYDNSELINYKDKIESLGHIFDNIEIFHGIFRPATYMEMSEIRESASLINHRNEKGILWMKIFRPKVVSTLCTQWNLTKKIGDAIMPLEINEINCSNMYEHLLIEIVNRWAKKIGAFGRNNVINSEN